MTHQSTSHEQEAITESASPEAMASATMPSSPPPPVELQAGGGFGMESEESESDLASSLPATSAAVAQSQLSISEEATRQPIQAKFTVTSSLSAKGDNVFPAFAISVDRINMAENDRPDTQFGDRQWSHGVAWTSMVEKWQRLLTGPLDKVILRLFDMAKKDHGSDENSASRELRSQAMQLLEGWKKKECTVQEWMQRLNKAISLYIQAYQKSSFATHKTKPGGRGESHAKAELRDMDSKTQADSSYQPGPQEILERAQKLLDISFRQKPDQVMKVYADWIEMFTENYSYLGEQNMRKIMDILNARKLSKGFVNKFKVQTLGELMQIWALSPKGTGSDLNAPSSSAPKEMGFVVNSVMSVQKQRLYKMQDVWVNAIELAEGDRPQTQFGSRQLSHFVAWTGKIIEWKAAFSGANLREVFTRLMIMAQKDDASDKNPQSKKLRSQLGVIANYLDGNESASVSNWTALLNRAVALYAEAYQMASFTTHADKPGGRGEGQARKRLLGLEQALQQGNSVDMPSAQQVVKSCLMLLDAPFNKGMDYVCKAYDDWLDMLETGIPSVMKVFMKDIHAHMKKTGIPTPWSSASMTDNLLDLVQGWRKKRKLKTFGLPMGDSKVHDPDSKSDKYAPTQEQIDEIQSRNLTLQRIKADGDCLYNSLIQANLSKVPNSVKALRHAVADKLELTDAWEADSIRNGGWVGNGADAAPAVLAGLYDVTFMVIHPNGAVESIGDGSRIVTLVLVMGPPQHYHFAR